MKGQLLYFYASDLRHALDLCIDRGEISAETAEAIAATDMDFATKRIELTGSRREANVMRESCYILARALRSALTARLNDEMFEARQRYDCAMLKVSSDYLKNRQATFAETDMAIDDLKHERYMLDQQAQAEAIGTAEWMALKSRMGDIDAKARELKRQRASRLEELANIQSREEKAIEDAYAAEERAINCRRSSVKTEHAALRASISAAGAAELPGLKASLEKRVKILKQENDKSYD